MNLDLMGIDDPGMYVWAGILAVVALAAAFGVAVGWQRWRDEKKKRSAPESGSD